MLCRTLKIMFNSKIKISGDMCDRRTYIEQISGKVWNSVKKLLGSQKYELKTNVYYSNVCVRGTEFSVEITSDEAIISVYESAVEVFPIVQNPVTSNDAKDFEQITKDYQAGKITIEEYMKKTQEFREKNDFDKLEKNMKSKMCNAGYMVKVTDKVSDPEPITPGSNWFDDVNFKK